MKPRILVFADWYSPGYKAGGALTAISNLIELMGHELDFYVFTRDRDRTDKGSYPDTCLNRWVQTGKAHVFYTADLSLRNIRRRILEVRPQIIYLNSFFSRLTVRTLMLRKLRLLTEAAVVLAPRGEFSQSALDLKRSRKLLYLKAAFAAGLCRNVLWQASSTREVPQIRAMIAKDGLRGAINIQLVPDVPDPNLLAVPLPAPRPPKVPGAAHFVFLSRVSRVKNLDLALELLGALAGEIQLDIYGPIDDQIYWKACQEQMRQLPSSIHVRYLGPVPQNQVADIFHKSHFQLLPTRGENFGYVILESLAAGCPVVISDQTPWQRLSLHGVGWDLPLPDRAKWLETLQHCVEMDQAAHSALSQRCRSYCVEWLATTPYRRSTLDLFQTALERSTSFNEPLATRYSKGAGD